MTTGTIQARLKNVPMLLNNIPYTVEEVTVTLSIYGIITRDCINGGYSIEDFAIGEILSIDDYEVNITSDIMSEKIITDKVNWDNVEFLYDTLEINEF